MTFNLPRHTINPHNSLVQIFTDKDISLDCIFQWNNRNIIRIRFQLNNIVTQEKAYQICHVQRCEKSFTTEQNETFSYYYLIQLFEPETTSVPSSSVFILKTVSKPIDLSKDKKCLFLFNVSTSPCKVDGSEYTCELNGGDPETKDGAVIVGGA